MVFVHYYKNISFDSRQAIKYFNRYAKKLTFDKTIRLFLYAINNKTESLRHHDQQLVNPNLKKAIGIDLIQVITKII